MSGIRIPKTLISPVTPTVAQLDLYLTQKPLVPCPFPSTVARVVIKDNIECRKNTGHVKSGKSKILTRNYFQNQRSKLSWDITHNLIFYDNDRIYEFLIKSLTIIFRKQLDLCERVRTADLSEKITTDKNKYFQNDYGLQTESADTKENYSEETPTYDKAVFKYFPDKVLVFGENSENIDDDSINTMVNTPLAIEST